MPNDLTQVPTSELVLTLRGAFASLAPDDIVRASEALTELEGRLLELEAKPDDIRVGG